jgi:uncharacterized membrane protein YcaP (DUF421 family)
MDLGRIVIRVVFAYVVLLVLIRLTGKTAVNHASPVEFVLAMVLGDLVDDAVWAEVNASTFVVAAGALFFVHTAFDLTRFRAGRLR